MNTFNTSSMLQKQLMDGIRGHIEAELRVRTKQVIDEFIEKELPNLIAGAMKIFEVHLIQRHDQYNSLDVRFVINDLREMNK